VVQGAGDTIPLVKSVCELGLYASFGWDNGESVNDALLLEKMAGAVLGALLRKPKSAYLIVVDGLDENRGPTALWMGFSI